jgi:hypothetical protein
MKKYISVLILATLIFNGCSVVGGAIGNARDKQFVYGKELTKEEIVRLDKKEIVVIYFKKSDSIKGKIVEFDGNKNLKVFDGNSDININVDDIDHGVIQYSKNTNMAVGIVIGSIIDIGIVATMIAVVTTMHTLTE